MSKLPEQSKKWLGYWLNPWLGVVSCLMTVFFSSVTSAQMSDPPAFAYLLHCSGCHIEDGSGDPPTVPDLRQNLDVLLSTAEGRAYMLQVPGVTDSPVPVAEMAELMNWLVTYLYPSLSEFQPFSVEEVQSGRTNRLADPNRVREKLLSRFSAKVSDEEITSIDSD